MTRPLPVSMIALFLLTSVATAHAECAWVLWSNGTVDPNVPLAFSTVQGSHLTWQPIAAFPSSQGCSASLSKWNDKEWADQSKRNANKPKGALWDAFTYRCLPDAVDPRGPKGK
jgi:hypothetical protein